MALPTNTGAFIHNGVNCTPNAIQTAQGVPYDNTSSGLSATNVQGAINEVYTCCIPLVYGTQTEATGNWVGELNISALYDGLTITYYLPYDSDGNVSLNLTLADGSTTGSKPVYLQIGKRLSTQFSAGATILITYYSAGSISRSGTPTDADMWVCNAESMQVQQVYIPNPPDIPYPVLFGVGLSVGNIFGPTVKDIYNLNYNPKTTTLTATKFSGDISSCNGLSGASVSYSNANSGLVATDVQGAIDEVNAEKANVSDFQVFSGMTRSTTDITTTNTKVTLQTKTFTVSRNSTIFVNFSAVIKTSRYTSGLNVYLDGTDIGYSCTNLTSYTTVIGSCTANIGSGSHTIELKLSGQDSGTTATLANYNTYGFNGVIIPR